jgi:hypothetical protein
MRQQLLNINNPKSITERVRMRIKKKNPERKEYKSGEETAPRMRTSEEETAAPSIVTPQRMYTLSPLPHRLWG